MKKRKSFRLTSMGSTSLAMTTSWAFFFSTRVVTVLTPCLTTGALLVGASSFPSALAAALSLSLSFLACLVSGLYLSRSLNSWVARQREVRSQLSGEKNYIKTRHRHFLPSSAVIALREELLAINTRAVMASR